MADKHTPTPWKVVNHLRDRFLVENAGGLVATLGGRFVDGKRCDAANAALIVRAVNRDHLFGELVDALQTLLGETVAALVSTFGDGPHGDKLEDEPVIRCARAILAKVKDHSHG